jgi:membrane-associated phospholipid phosphatase
MECATDRALAVDDFGPRERAAAAWRRALASPSLALDFLIVALMAGLPEFALPQHTRPLPAVADGAGGWARAFLLDNSYEPDTVSSLALMLIATLVPLAATLLLAIASPARGAVKAHVHSYLWMMGTQIMVVGCVKAYAGYWRPSFLHECAFNASLGACTAPDLRHAFRSFPSGHASNSIGPLLHTSLRLMGGLRLGHARYGVRLGARGPTLELDGALTAACLLPTFVGVWIAASRVHDHAHHPADVVGGALVGGGAAVLWHCRYFHAPFGPDSHRPRAP